MRKMPVFVSHYTVNTPYEQEVERLKTSLERFHLEYWIEAIQSFGSWRKNSNYCTEQVLKALEKFRNRDILRLDADAEIEKYPDIFEQNDFQEVDIAAHVHNFPWHKNELMGGTLYFANNEHVQAVVTEWHKQAMGKHWAKRNGDLLQKLIWTHKDNIRFRELPASYCRIFDTMRSVPPVITHHQASSRYKRLINTGRR